MGRREVRRDLGWTEFASSPLEQPFAVENRIQRVHRIIRRKPIALFSHRRQYFQLGQRFGARGFKDRLSQRGLITNGLSPRGLRMKRLCRLELRVCGALCWWDQAVNAQSFIDFAQPAFERGLFPEQGLAQLNILFKMIDFHAGQNSGFLPALTSEINRGNSRPSVSGRQFPVCPAAGKG